MHVFDQRTEYVEVISILASRNKRPVLYSESNFVLFLRAAQLVSRKILEVLQPSLPKMQQKKKKMCIKRAELHENCTEVMNPILSFHMEVGK